MTDSQRIKTIVVTDIELHAGWIEIKSVATYKDTKRGRFEAELLYRGLVEATAPAIPDLVQMAEHVKNGLYQNSSRIVTMKTSSV